MNRREFSKLFAAATGSLVFLPMGRIAEAVSNESISAANKAVLGVHALLLTAAPGKLDTFLTGLGTTLEAST